MRRGLRVPLSKLLGNYPNFRPAGALPAATTRGSNRAWPAHKVQILGPPLGDTAGSAFALRVQGVNVFPTNAFPQMTSGSGAPGRGNSLLGTQNMGPALGIRSSLSKQEVPFKEETG